MSESYPVSEPRAWVEIDLGAMKSNLAAAREASGAELMMVVKANAYGHGLKHVTKAMEGAGVSFFGVANVGEARRIRDAGVETRIYLLGPTWAGEREEVVAREWTACLSSVEEAWEFEKLAAAAGKVLKVHLAVDTGMGRGGFVIEELPGVMEKLDGMGHLEIEGLVSHLPSADEDVEFTKGQIARFHEVLEVCGGVERFRYRHLLNSAGLLGYDRGLCNLARPGLMVYGVSPLAGFQEKLRTVMTMKSRVTLIRTLPAGHGVSYGRLFVTEKPTRVATVGVGYGDGYPRHISGQGGEVWLKGRRFPILGRVTMDQIMIDVTGAADVAEGDEVEIFGANLPVGEVAEKAGTIVWEIYTGITPRVVRCYC
ncbi:MAG: alanine racemase [Verrucomicrobiales bacterium]